MKRKLITFALSKIGISAVFGLLSTFLAAQTNDCNDNPEREITVGTSCNPVTFNTADDINWWVSSGSNGTCGEASGDAWMWFDAPSASSEINYKPLVLDAVMTIFEGACNSSGTSFACSNDSSYGGQETITLATIPLTRYHVRIENYYGNEDMGGTVCVVNNITTLGGFSMEKLLVQCVDEMPLITWQTTVNNNVDHSDIEKSTGGFSWKKVTTLINGVYQNGKEYFSYQDETGKGTAGYYRVRQFRANDEEVLSSVVFSGCEDESKLFVPYPNPSKGLMILEYESTSDTPFQLFDLRGKLVFTQLLERSMGRKTIQLTAEEVPPGMYVYQFVPDTEIRTGALIIEE